MRVREHYLACCLQRVALLMRALRASGSAEGRVGESSEPSLFCRFAEGAYGRRAPCCAASYSGTAYNKRRRIVGEGSGNRA